MNAPRNVKLLKASYLKNYIYRFEFSNGVVSDVNFKPMLKGYLVEFLDITKFKKMKCDEYGNGDIRWGKNWEMCFHIHAYYKETKVIPIDPLSNKKTPIKKERKKKITEKEKTERAIIFAKEFYKKYGGMLSTLAYE